MPSTSLRKDVITSAQSIVVKVGTHVLTNKGGRLNVRRLSHLCAQIAELTGQRRKIVLVSSGAIAAGVGRLNLPGRPRNIPDLQAAAAVGQGQLMHHFEQSLSRHGLHAAQILLTRSDFENRQRYLNIRNTIGSLHRLGAIPIINENDTVAVDELVFGDNDLIAAAVANMLRADTLIILTVVDGVVRDGKTTDLIEQFDQSLRDSITSEISEFGAGGMASKLQAAFEVTEAGEAAIIANGRTPRILTRLIGGEKLGTVITPATRKMAARKRWIGMTARTSGRIVVDAGAAAALRQGGKSLLAIGITAVRGRFEPGAAVRIESDSGEEIGRGLVNYSADQLERIAGKRSDRFASILGEGTYQEVIHRDNLTIRRPQ
jgi:glutamate 5-kinase